LQVINQYEESGGNRAEKKQGIIEKLMKFFEKYAGLV